MTRSGGEVIFENSLVGESQSNGLVENAVREIQNQARKLKHELEFELQFEMNFNMKQNYSLGAHYYLKTFFAMCTSFALEA